MLGSCCMNSAQLPPSQSVRCVSAVLLNSHLMSPWYLGDNYLQRSTVGACSIRLQPGSRDAVTQIRSAHYDQLWHTRQVWPGTCSCKTRQGRSWFSALPALTGSTPASFTPILQQKAVSQSVHQTLSSTILFVLQFFTWSSKFVFLCQ